MINEKPFIHLVLTGDVMTGRGIDQALPCAGDTRIYESYMRSAKGYVALAEARNGDIPAPLSFGHLWGDALGAMDAREPECRIINLETAVTRCEDAWPGKGINYRMHPGNVPTLTAAQIDICSLANNHVLDWRYEGLAETLEDLQDAGLRTAGAGESLTAAAAPAIAPIGDRRLLLFACGHYSSGIPESWATAESKAGVNVIGDLSARTARALAQQINACREPRDRVLVSIHWGGNWGYRIARGQWKFARALIDAGVDLVHGHSSHHPQGMEVYRGRAILYGCGDLINDYEGISGHEEYRPQLRALYCVDLDCGSGALGRLELIPFEMRHFRLQQPAPRGRDWLLQTMERECRHLGTALRPLEGREGFLLNWD